MHATENLAEADRIMTICNACRYCEGHCAVFPAMEMRLDFSRGDLEYLANLCHNCGACYHHCQYAEPHEFAVNVPRTMARLRTDTYGDYAWPPVMRGVLQKNGLWVSILTAVALAVFIAGTALFAGPSRFFSVHENGFYGVIPHNVMAGLFSTVSLFVVSALVMGIARYWRAIGLPNPLGAGAAPVLTAVRNALTLKYLDGGGGDGCTYPDERPSLLRRTFHHMTFYGFMLCFAATSTGTVYHYAFGWEAPYPLLSLPKLFGITGGIGLLIGPAGLLWLKRRADPEPVDEGSTGMDLAFLVLLFLTSATGLLLYAVTGTRMVGPALAIHLGVVLALFLSMPYGKFVHGFYRLVALLAYAIEQEETRAVAGRPVSVRGTKPAAP